MHNISHIVNKSKIATKLVAFPTGKSKVWQHFGFKVDSQEKIVNKKVVCRKCEKLLTYSENTTNLTLHLKQYHEEEYLKEPNSLCVSQKEQLKIDFIKHDQVTDLKFKSCKEALMEYLWLNINFIFCY